MFWKRKPPIEYSDQALHEVSEMFSQNEQQPTFGIEHLNVVRLDYSIDSLAEVNRYLDLVRLDQNIESVWNQVVLRCGAYVGEVIRKNSTNREWHWLDYQNALKADRKSLEDFGYSIATAAVLYIAPASFCFPLAKVEKYLMNGPEDDVRFFAEAAVTEGLVL